MRAIHVFLAVLLMVMAVSASALGAYGCDWYEDFEWSSVQPPPDPWVVNNMQLVTSPVHNDNSAIQQIPDGAASYAYADLRGLTEFPCFRGYAKFWVYDPGKAHCGQTDARGSSPLSAPTAVVRCSRLRYSPATLHSTGKLSGVGVPS